MLNIHKCIHKIDVRRERKPTSLAIFSVKKIRTQFHSRHLAVAKSYINGVTLRL